MKWVLNAFPAEVDEAFSLLRGIHPNWRLVEGEPAATEFYDKQTLLDLGVVGIYEKDDPAP